MAVRAAVETAVVGTGGGDGGEGGGADGGSDANSAAAGLLEDDDCEAREQEEAAERGDGDLGGGLERMW